MDRLKQPGPIGNLIEHSSYPRPQEMDLQDGLRRGARQGVAIPMMEEITGSWRLRSVEILRGTAGLK